MKVKIVDLTGAALDWAVAQIEVAEKRLIVGVVWGKGSVKADGYWQELPNGRRYSYVLRPVHSYWVKRCEDYPFGRDTDIWSPSTDYSQGGPIIDREKISIRQWTNVPVVHAYMPVDGAEWSSDAKSPLVAAMRCYVMSKLGDEVDVPDELLKA